MKLHMYSLFDTRFLTDCGFYLLLFLALFIGLKIIEKILSRPEFSNTIIDYNLFRKAAKPIYYLILFLLLLKINDEIVYETKNKNQIENIIIKKTPQIRSILIIIFVTISIFSFIQNLQKNYIVANRGKDVDLYAIDIFAKLSSLILFSIAGLAIMQKIGIGLGALATLGGASGVIIGFMVKDFFSNISGLLSIYFDKPFIIGDEITIFDRSFTITNGVVEEIGLRLTAIRTINNKSLVYIPNSIFNTNIIENNSRITNKLFERNLKISFDGDMKKINCAINHLIKKIHNFDFIDHNQKILIKISDMDEDFVYLNIRIFFIGMNAENFTLKSNSLMEMIMNSFKENDLCLISKDEKFIVIKNEDHE